MLHSVPTMSPCFQVPAQIHQRPVFPGVHCVSLHVYWLVDISSPLGIPAVHSVSTLSISAPQTWLPSWDFKILFNCAIVHPITNAKQTEQNPGAVVEFLLFLMPSIHSLTKLTLTLYGFKSVPSTLCLHTFLNLNPQDFSSSSAMGFSLVFLAPIFPLQIPSP